MKTQTADSHGLRIRACTVGIALLLSGCAVPSPRLGFKGTQETLTVGSAFDVTVGMDVVQAHRVLMDGGQFQFKGRACIKSGTEDQLDITMPKAFDTSRAYLSKPDCGADDVQELWRSDHFTDWVPLLLNIHDDHIVRIKWWHAHSTNLL